jgi:hypothetical protein
VVVLKVPGSLVHWRSIRHRGVNRFGLAAWLLLFTLWAAREERPLRLRFGLSRDAFDRAVAQLRSTGFPAGAQPRQLGLYPVDNVFRLGDGVAVGVPGMNLKYANGFICFPDGEPAESRAFGQRLRCTPVGGGWYIWEYIR